MSLKNEKKTWSVIYITLLMMVLEIIGGLLWGSMALLADGWHMGTHAAALGISAFAYFYERKQKGNPDFVFGTAKINTLGGFTSAIILILVSLMMIVESAERLITPVKIELDESILVAIIGLIVNLFCAWLLGEDHDHGHSHHSHESCEHHGHEHHTHDHHRVDHNLKAAYLHVLADAMTSVLAIAALLCAKYFGLVFLDPVIGILGAIVILRWSRSLIIPCSAILLDRYEKNDHHLQDQDREYLKNLENLHIFENHEDKTFVKIPGKELKKIPPQDLQKLLEKMSVIIEKEES